MDFSTLTGAAWERGDNGSLTLDEFPETWMQGRTLFGAGMAATGLRALYDPERTPRTVHVNFIGPLTGGVIATPSILRAGRSMTHGQVLFHEGDALKGQVFLSMGGGRESSVSYPPTPATELPDPEASTLIEMPFLPGLTPNFTQNFVYRWASQSFPYTGTESGAISGWCRFKQAPGPSHAALLGLVDSWPSPALPMMKKPGPSSSVTWTTHFAHVPETITVDDWFWMTSRITQAEDGYAHMTGTLYTREGVLTARFEQLVAIFG